MLCLGQIVSKLGSSEMAGEIAVLLNIPQPFTVRTRRLSQVIRMSHNHFKQILQPDNEDAKTLLSNFIEVCYLFLIMFTIIANL